ncbi:helix-turn-helix domain-containing protein, partial [Corynebacterium hesseae]
MRDAAKKAGFNQSAFTRWKGGAKADPEFVVKFARAFHLNVLEALVEAEFITEKEASLGSNKGERLHATLHAFEAEALALNAASEIAEHAAASIKAAYVKDILGETIQASEFPNWRELDRKFKEACETEPTPHLTPVSDTSDSLPDEDDGTVMEWDDSIPHAADSSIDEQAERERRGEDLID